MLQFSKCCFFNLRYESTNTNRQEVNSNFWYKDIDLDHTLDEIVTLRNNIFDSDRYKQFNWTILLGGYDVYDLYISEIAKQYILLDLFQYFASNSTAFKNIYS